MGYRWTALPLVLAASLSFSACGVSVKEDESSLSSAPPYPSFSWAEKQRHLEVIDTITRTAAECLNETYDEHVNFYEQHGVSKFYGERRRQHQSRAGLIKELERFGQPASLVDELVPTACITLALNCLEEGFVAAGQQSTFKKIIDYLKIDNKVYGTDLQNMLQALGWQTLYWNPKPSNNTKWDAEDKRLNPLKPGRQWMPVWGGHAYRYRNVMNKNQYYGIKIDDKETLVDFGTRVPDSFKQHPFFIGTAHAGYHVFPGTFGRVIEAHSTRPLNAFDNLEFSPFNPLASGGGPRRTRSEKYRSGVIVVPPVY